MQKVYVLKHFETLTELANTLGISQAAVSRWHDIIPEKQALRLERLTDGELRYDPELYKQAA